MKPKKLIQFLEDLQVLIRERGTSWPSNWKDIPKRIQKDFLSWVVTYKQQTWEEMEQRAWDIYHLEYIAFLIKQKIEELKDDENDS